MRAGRAHMCLLQAKNRGVGAPRRGEKKEGPKEGHVSTHPRQTLIGRWGFAHRLCEWHDRGKERGEKRKTQEKRKEGAASDRKEIIIHVRAAGGLDLFGTRCIS